jgi:hypothetical protein
MSEISTWSKLSAINVNEYIEKKPNGMSYLSWVWAWGITKATCPDANYRVVSFDGKPYLHDQDLGYLVQTEVTISGETIPMHLFVMDGANKAQKNIDYEYTVKSGKKTCHAATMFDINTAIMRCLTKNLAMFGLGHYVYAGEDIPTESEEVKQIKTAELIENWGMTINAQQSLENLKSVWLKIPKEIKDSLLDTKERKKKELENLEEVK